MILARLRSETSALHQQVEQAVGISSSLDSLENYSTLLGRFLGFYAPLEARLIETAGLDALGLDLKDRLKADRLREDLAVCGYSREAILGLPVCRGLPEVATLPSALGTLYVLEGATLGGNFIRKEVQKHLGLGPETGCSFFASYRDRVGPMWNDFCNVLNDYSNRHPDDEDSIVMAASATFLKFEAWIVGESRCRGPVNAQ